MNEPLPDQGAEEAKPERIREPTVVDAVAAVRAGDTEAFGLIVERYQSEIRSLSMALMRNAGAAEELAQDVFVRAYRHLDTFDEQRPIFPWLAKITYRLAQTRKVEKARKAAAERDMRSRPAEACTEADPLDKLVADERNRQLWEAVGSLPVGERTSVLLFYRYGLSIREVAQVIGVSMGTIKTYLFRGRRRLQTRLRPLAEGSTGKGLE